ncbi:hypothetical protein DL95DRAFT_504805 [Leptodontidium sp. 2 PMI_412]|nr:hypothetical protein DL95DRAFT_504805 [Leptodontidium sp. 2 PMI_412]
MTDTSPQHEPEPEDEPEHEPDTEPEESLFIPSGSKSEAVQKQVTLYRSTSKHDFTWQHSGTFDQLVQVQEREKAMRAGLLFLHELERNLKAYSANVPSAAKWLDRIKLIKANRRECRILIGFLGCTGAGKSSMINSLLNQEDLLPADDEKACTAVCVEISWNASEDPKEAFRAKIERISEDDWRTELERLLSDISDQALNKDGDDGEPDLERDMRIKTAFQKLKCVYPHVKSIPDLKAYKIKDLLEHPNVKDVLGKSKNIMDESREDFAAQIKPYIDSSTSKEVGSSGKAFAHWPLVKLVRLHVKSRILKDGIVLVDLPGSMDTNAARGAIADNYQKNLSVNCIVAPTARAASDKPAQDLLGQVAQRTLQLDNRFSADHLCFIVSKIDSSLNVARYIRNHPEVQDALFSEFEKEVRLKSKLDQANDIIDQKEQSQAANKKLVAELQSQLRKLGAQPKKSTGAGRGRGKKRKRDDDVQIPDDPVPTPEQKAAAKKRKELQAKMKEAKENADRDGNKLFDATKRMKAIEQALAECESRKFRACVKNRNKVSTTEIRKDFESARRQMGCKDEMKPLQVFCVSSWAFTLLNDKKIFPGFPKLQDSGIPKLQDWLCETTLPTRDQNALAFLEDLISLELSMVPWLADTSVEFKMSGGQRTNVEKYFTEQFDNLKKELAKLTSQIVTKCESIVSTELFPKMAKAEHTAGSNAERIVKSWAQKPMHWGTHRALNRERGTWTTHSGIVINWNDELAGNYLNLLVKDWTLTLHNKVPAHQSIYDSAIDKVIQKFTKTVVGSVEEMCPDLQEALYQWLESSLRSIVPIHKTSQAIFSDIIPEAIRESHRLVEPKIKDCWQPVYDLCGAETGPGHYKRNQLAHVTHVQKIGRGMYRKSSATIKTAFKKLWDNLPEEFQKGTNPASLQIQDEFFEMLENYTAHSDGGDSYALEASSSKAQLQDRVRNLFRSLKTVWSQVVEIVDIEEEYESQEDEEPEIDDLLNDDDDEDDDYDLSDEGSSAGGE